MRKQKRVTVNKRFYAISHRSYTTVAQSDNLERLQKRCKQIANNFVDGNESFAIYDTQAYPQERSRVGTFDKDGYTTFYH